MTNDTTTLNGALSELGETMADNLVAMGVLDASANDGLTTLAGKILCIEPSIGGLDLDTAVTLSASSASIVRGQSVVLTSKLTATYDDETLVNVDLSGVLTGATILFKEGNTTLGSGVTDSNGIATATISNLSVASHTIKAVFAGTDNFNDCESSSVSVTVTAPAVDSITLVKSAGKDILSYADVSSGTEFCTLTATVLDDNDDPIPGETVVLKKNNVTWDTLTTDSNGQVSKTYTSSGVGDLEFVAQCGSILSEIYAITDYRKYDSCATDKTSNYAVGTGVSLTYDSTKQAYLLTKTVHHSMSAIDVNNVSLPNTSKISVDMMFTGSGNQQLRYGLLNGTTGAGTAIVHTDVDSSYTPIYLAKDGGTTIRSQINLNLALNVWYTLEMEYSSSSFNIKIKQGDTVIVNDSYNQSTLASSSNTLCMVVGHDSSARIYIKEIKSL